MTCLPVYMLVFCFFTIIFKRRSKYRHFNNFYPKLYNIGMSVYFISALELQ